jgi:hypothetical protein
VFVFWETAGQPPLHAARVALGALAILAMIALVPLAVVASDEPGFPILRFVGSAVLPIVAWAAVVQRAPGRRAITLATIAAALDVASSALSMAAAVFVGSFLAEAGRQSGGPPLDGILLGSGLARLAIAGRALWALRPLALEPADGR